MLSPEKFHAANKATIATFVALSGKSVEAVEKLAALNLQVTKTALNDAAELAQTLLAAKDPQAFVAAQSGLVQPAIERAVEYGRSVYEIVAETMAEFTKSAEANAAESQEALRALVEASLKNAPAGSENAVALVKSAVAAANNAYETVQKVTKQAANVVEANFQTMTPPAAAKAAPARSRKAA